MQNMKAPKGDNRFEFCTKINANEKVDIFAIAENPSSQTLTLGRSDLHALADPYCKIVNEDWLNERPRQVIPITVFKANFNDFGLNYDIMIHFGKIMAQRRNPEYLFTKMKFHVPNDSRYSGMVHIKEITKKAGATVMKKSEVESMKSDTVYVILTKDLLGSFDVQNYKLKPGACMKLLSVEYIVDCLLQQRRLDVSCYLISEKNQTIAFRQDQSQQVNQQYTPSQVQGPVQVTISASSLMDRHIVPHGQQVVSTSMPSQQASHPQYCRNTQEEHTQQNLSQRIHWKLDVGNGSQRGHATSFNIDYPSLITLFGQKAWKCRSDPEAAWMILDGEISLNIIKEDAVCNARIKKLVTPTVVVSHD